MSFDYQCIMSWTEKPQEKVYRTKFDGPIKAQRQRYYNTWMTANVTFLMTKTQYDSFLTWYQTNNSSFFDITDHRNTTAGSPQGTLSVRIVSGEFDARPVAQHNTDHWVLSTQLEYKL